MKKIIFLAAVAATGSAFAQVTVYGKADLGVSSATTTGAVNQGLQLVGGGYEGMRLGFKGSKDLGGGVTGSFQLEKGVTLAGLEGAGFNRVASLSISSSMGTVGLGRQWTPYDNAFGTGDAMEYNGFSASNLAMYSGRHGDNGATGAGNALAMQYSSPVMGGFQAFVMYAPNADASATQSNTAYNGYGLNYASGPLTINFAGERVLNTVHNGATAAVGYTNAYVFSATYDMGAAKLYGHYESAQAENVGADNGFGLGVKVPMGNAYVTVGFATEDSKLSNATASSAANAWGAQYIYNWTKEAVVYVGYKSLSTTPAGGGTVTTSNTLASGVRYNF